MVIIFFCFKSELTVSSCKLKRWIVFNKAEFTLIFHSQYNTKPLKLYFGLFTCKHFGPDLIICHNGPFYLFKPFYDTYGHELLLWIFLAFVLSAQSTFHFSSICFGGFNAGWMDAITKHINCKMKGITMRHPNWIRDILKWPHG